MADRVTLLESFAVEAENELPNFPAYIAVVALGLLIVVGNSTWRHRGESLGDESVDLKRGVLCFLVLLAYVALLEFTALPFSLLSVFLIFLMGAVICDWDRKRLLLLAEIALIAGLGTEFIFGSFFGVSLP